MLELIIKSDKLYTVYMHVSPSKKVYVGITCEDPPSLRWGFGGGGYRPNKHFWNAIQKYGWDNFEHNIVATNLIREDALNMERVLVSQYSSNNPEFGYNLTSGGDRGTRHNPETIEKIRLSSAERWRTNPEYRAKMIELSKGRKFTPEQIKRISESNKRTKKLHPRTPEQTEKWRKSRGKVVPWNKGLVGVTHHTDEAKARIGAAFRGKHLSEEHKRKISEGRKDFVHSDETKAKLREIALNMSQEQRQQISDSLKQHYVEIRANQPPAEPRVYKRSPEARRRMSESKLGKLPYNCKKIQCVETGQVYVSIAEASRQLGITDIGDVLDDPNHCRKRLHFITYTDAIKED